MITFATYFNIGKLRIYTWIFPGTEHLINATHLFGNIYWG